MKDEDFQYYQSLLLKESGLTITQDKIYLLDSRLTPVAKSRDYSSLEEMTQALRTSTAGRDLIVDVVEAMTTNETSFFRDTRPFDILRDTVLPYVLKNKQSSRRVRIWCAAASSGQEPYSIAMILKEAAEKLAGWSFEIVATDISHDILDKAKQGRYSQFDVQRGLPIQYLMKYFEQQDEYWQVKDEIRNMISYQYFNLLSDMSSLGTFDIVFCRNVLIYFNEEIKADVLRRTSERMVNDGFLFLGGAETVLGITDKFTPMADKRGLYLRSGQDYKFDTETAIAATQ